MCRNIRVLHHFEPPATREEVRDAALQFVRKVSGRPRPSLADQEPFGRAVDEIAEATRRLLAALGKRGEPRTREGEREKARQRWKRRQASLSRP